MSERRRGPVATRASIFRRTEDGVPELAKQPDVSVSEQPARIKRTYYLPNEVIVTLGAVQLARHRATGKKPEVSELVEEAIRLLAEKERPAI